MCFCKAVEKQPYLRADIAPCVHSSLLCTWVSVQKPRVFYLNSPTTPLRHTCQRALFASHCLCSRDSQILANLIYKYTAILKKVVETAHGRFYFGYFPRFFFMGSGGNWSGLSWFLWIPSHASFSLARANTPTGHSDCVWIAKCRWHTPQNVSM